MGYGLIYSSENNLRRYLLVDCFLAMKIRPIVIGIDSINTSHSPVMLGSLPVVMSSSAA